MIGCDTEIDLLQCKFGTAALAFGEFRQADEANLGYLNHY